MLRFILDLELPKIKCPGSARYTDFGTNAEVVWSASSVIVSDNHGVRNLAQPAIAPKALHFRTSGDNAFATLEAGVTTITYTVTFYFTFNSS